MPIPINRTRSKAKAGMRKSGNKSFRPEQKLVHDILKECAIGITELQMEYKPKSIVPLKGTDLTGIRSPTLDIYFKFEDTEVAIRLNGPYHDELKQERKDNIQQLFLENQPIPWQVFNFKYWDMQYVFKRNKRKLTKSELIQAYNEIKRSFIMTKIKLKIPTDEILNKLAILHCN